MNREHQFNIWYWIAALLLILAFQGWWQRRPLRNAPDRVM
jgi:hypothetical protein